MRRTAALALLFALLLARSAPAQTRLRDAETDELVERLSDSSPAARGGAVAELGERRAVEALPAILRSLDDSESYVRARAAEALRRIGDERAVPRLARALEDPDATTRCRVVLALGDLADLYIVPTVRRALRDEAAVVRAAAVRALGELGDPLALEDVLSAQAREEEDPDGAVTAAALVAAAKLAGPEGLRRSEAIAGGRIARSWFLRAVLARSAGLAGDRERESELAGFLRRDPDPRVVQAAAWALARLGATTPLEEALANEEPFRRRAAVAAFAGSEAGAAEAVLREAVVDEDPGIRLEAAAALLRRGRAGAVPVLIRLLDEVDASVWMGALATLEAATGLELGRNPPAWARWWEENRETFTPSVEAGG